MFNKILFLIGMWTMTQIGVVGYLGISEFVLFLIAPFIYLRNRLMFKRDGLGTFYALIFLTMVSCLISGLYNRCGLLDTIKGFASIYGLFAGVTVLYPMLRRNPDGLKWLLLGFAVSSVVSIFIFQSGAAHVGADVSRESLQTTVMSYSLFWIVLANRWFTLPIEMFYLRVPYIYSVFAPLSLAAYALLTTSSGRSAFLVLMFSVLLIALGGKSHRSLKVMRKNFMLVIVSLLVGGWCFGTFYKYAARNGYLGEKSREKYERQMGGKKDQGILGMLISGRVEFFIGAMACVKHPFLGCGPKAVDKDGLVGRFYDKYGTAEEISAYTRSEMGRRQYGFGYRGIPAHSHIIAFWLWFGLPGAMLWLYVLCVMYRALKNYSSTVPQWYGYFAIMLPAALWAIFFSPFGDRVEKAALIACCFVVKNIYEGRVRLPDRMIYELSRSK